MDIIALGISTVLNMDVIVFGISTVLNMDIIVLRISTILNMDIYNSTRDINNSKHGYIY